MIIREPPQTSVHKTTVPHPSPGDPTYVTDWGSFPSRHRTHIHTMRARSAIVNRKYLGSERKSRQSRPQSANEGAWEGAWEGRAPPQRCQSARPTPSFPAHTQEEVHRAKMGELPFVSTSHRYPLSPQRPASAAPASIARLMSAHTASTRARSAGPGGHGGRGRQGGPGGYNWVTLSLFCDSKRALYDSEGGLRGSKRTTIK
jgi:hypothetical protein